MVSKEYLRFFKEHYQRGKLRLDGLTPKQQRSRRGQASTYLWRTKKQMIEDMEVLAILASLLPEKHLTEVFTEKNVDRLVSALLTQGQKKSRKTDPHYQGMVEREHHIASMLMLKGIGKCVDEFDIANSKNRELSRFIAEDAKRMFLILRAPTYWSGVALNYDFNPAVYENGKRALRHHVLAQPRERALDSG
jgi:hypothetical protein